jgi:hypothetical protein
MNKIFKYKTNFKVNFWILSILFFLFSCGNNEPEKPEEEDLSMYITEVFEYVYAPGQHAQGRNSEEEKRNFIGKPTRDTHLGGFGGYIIAGFDHNVPNVAGKFDFEIFSTGAAPEPGMVFVMSDENGDGLPNGTWYELRGSEFDNPKTIRNYSLTYFRAKSDTENITWRDNQGNSGELISGFGGQYSSNWWWSETKTDSITFTGTRLPDSHVNVSTGNNEHWIVPDTIFTWGYAKNNQGSDYNRTNRSNQFDIANAVDENGNPVYLPHIRFIKIQTAVFQQAGWLNEVSTEVQGARSLHAK